MRAITTLIFLATFLLVKCHPDQGLNTVQLIRKHGYPVERHRNLMTQDGYILEMHRIPHGRRNSTSSGSRPPLLIMHGILSSSADWVNMGPGKGLAYVLADAGYDVWMGNARGSTWSRKHARLDPDKDKEFWNFSWHEIGIYDLPTMIDHILSKTGEKKVLYVAHSQGTTAFFVMASTLPDYSDKIKFAITMAPIAFMSNVRSLLVREIAKFSSSLEWIADWLGLYEFLPENIFLTAFAKEYCQDQNILQALCSNALFIISGFNARLNETMLPVILTNSPAGASTKQFIHFGQEISSGDFCQYDHGEADNRKIYGSKYPPMYDLKKIKIPIAMFYGAGDVLTEEKDVVKLYRKLPNVVYKHKIRDEKFGHLDFMWGITAPNVLYKRMISLLANY